jgi:hypothetical protein
MDDIKKQLDSMKKQLADLTQPAIESFPMPAFNMHDRLRDLHKYSKIPELAERKDAEKWFNAFRQRILKLRNKIQADQELLIYSCNPAGELILVQEFSYINPDRILLCGYDGAGNYTEELVNVGAVNVRIKIVPIQNDEPIPNRRRIGFIQDED